MTAVAKTTAALKKQLSGALKTRNENDWTLAAIFYAWSEGVSDGIGILAAIKIPGFASESKVRGYRDAYARAIEEGIVLDVRPGDEIVIPTSTFQIYFERTDFKVKQNIKNEQKRNGKARSIQGERQPRVDNNPVINPPRVSSNLERAQRVVHEIDVMIKAESDKKGIAYQTLSLLKMQAENAVNVYKTAVKR